MRRLLHAPRLFLAGLLFIAGGVSAGWPSIVQAATQEQTPEQAPTKPHASTDAVKKELTDIIDAQLAAFRADDYDKAYGFAASSIQSMFPAADFAMMVKTGYPVIAHSAKADYGLSFDTGEDAVVNVRIEDAAKKSGEYQYLLKKENGVWKISGVAELKSSDLTV